MASGRENAERDTVKVNFEEWEIIRIIEAGAVGKDNVRIQNVIGLSITRIYGGNCQLKRLNFLIQGRKIVNIIHALFIVPSYF
jgi:hypothetical protein